MESLFFLKKSKNMQNLFDKIPIAAIYNKKEIIKQT